ncbi:hypothetical protein GGQ88_001488 [Novosphingobium hassiacum]|uniref:Uncharacterized protein n=1 Tax=Novosphingobium hassiacum TaxID=173676 RepID=A0A7W6EVE6_9SPHN|nr:hypothetical protein [Novosphingobium hassiacum]MBB3860222.1 hypothetical protein [Novosphingobium hassiacum]
MTRPALAIVMGGVLCGAVIAQAVPTDPSGTLPRPSKPIAAEAYPEIVAITYETQPGAASDPYNFTPHRPLLRTADLQYQLEDAAPGYQEPDYDDVGTSSPDPQITEEDDEAVEQPIEMTESPAPVEAETANIPSSPSIG